jgi:hypothetical protein
VPELLEPTVDLNVQRLPVQRQPMDEWERDLFRAADEVKDDDLPYEE